MRYFFKHNFFNLKQYTIKNQFNESCYIVTERLFSIGNKLFLSDSQGSQVYKIEQRLFKFLPEYCICENGEEVAKVKKKFSIFKPEFDIGSRYGDFTFHGDVNDYMICKAGKIVVKTFISINSTYSVSIIDNDYVNHGFLLAVVIAVDLSLENVE